MQAAVADPYLLALLAYVAGGNIQLSDFRAATTHPGGHAACGSKCKQFALNQRQGCQFLSTCKGQVVRGAVVQNLTPPGKIFFCVPGNGTEMVAKNQSGS